MAPAAILIECWLTYGAFWGKWRIWNAAVDNLTASSLPQHTTIQCDGWMDGWVDGLMNGWMDWWNTTTTPAEPAAAVDFFVANNGNDDNNNDDNSNGNSTTTNNNNNSSTAPKDNKRACEWDGVGRSSGDGAPWAAAVTGRRWATLGDARRSARCPDTHAPPLSLLVQFNSLGCMLWFKYTAIIQLLFKPISFHQLPLPCLCPCVPTNVFCFVNSSNPIKFANQATHSN